MKCARAWPQQCEISRSTALVMKITRALLTRLDGVQGSRKHQKAHSPFICTDVDECHIVELDRHLLSSTLRIGDLPICPTRRSIV
jgi:hypothetical protein